MVGAISTLVRRRHARSHDHRSRVVALVAGAVLLSQAALASPISAAAVPQQLDVSIATGADDAEESAAGVMSLASTDIELVADGSKGNQIIGLRFTGVAIPPGATITAGAIQFTTDEASSDPTTVTIQAQDADSAAPFTGAAFNLSTRPRTSAGVSWSPPAWPTVGVAGVDQRTPDLATIVQAVVARAGWTSGNALAFIITGTGHRVASAFEKGASVRARLHVEFTTDGAATPVVTSFAPASGPPGASVTVLGSGLASATRVTIGGSSAAYSVISDDELRVTVPPGAVSGPIQVTSPGGIATSAGSFTVEGARPIRVPQDHPTIQAAVDAATTGATIVVSPGQYAEHVVIDNKVITLGSEFLLTGDRAVIDTTIIQVDPTSAGITVEPGASGTAIVGITIRVTPGTSGVVDGVHAPASVTVTDSHIVGWDDGIDIGEVDGRTYTADLRNNVVEGGTDDGIDLDGATSAIVEGNTLRNNREDGIEIRLNDFAARRDIRIAGNTVASNGQDGIQIIDEIGASDRAFQIERNLIDGNGRAGIGLLDNGQSGEDYRAASLLDSITIVNNTFRGNNHGVSGGDNVVAVNNIITGSTNIGLKGVDGASVIAFNLLAGNGTDAQSSNVDPSTTITALPLLNADATLPANSPAVDMGTAWYERSGTTVLALPAAQFAGAAPDLGARESAFTAPGGSVFVGAGDIASCGINGDEGTAALLDTIPGTVFTTGDNLYGNQTLADFEACYGPSWGRHLARTRPVAGNHDYDTPGATGYYAYFGAAAGDPAKGYYSYELGAWHVVVLNSNCTEVGGCHVGSAQELWLRQDLAGSSSSCTVALWHEPRFSSGEHGDTSKMQPFWAALHEAGADLVLTGHDHDYERFRALGAAGTPDAVFGLTEFVVGTGGFSRRTFPTVRADSVIRDNTSDGVLKLTLLPTRFSWQFVAAAGATFHDAGSAVCHGRPGGATGDVTPPQTTISAAPPSSSSSADASFTFGADETATFVCSLDGGAFGACTSPRTYTGLADGSHTFQVRATDTSGNTDPTPASHTWTIATAPPGGTTVSFVASADAQVAEATPTTNFGTLTSLTSDTSPNTHAYLRFPVAGLSGTVTRATLRLYVTNGTPNGPLVQRVTDPWSESAVTWSTRPAPVGAAVANLGNVPANAWLDIDVTSAVAANGDVAFVLIPESSDGFAASSRESATNQPTLVVTTSGGPGGDTTPPDTTITAAPPASTTATDATFAFVANEAATFACSLDGGPFTSCSSPRLYSGLAVTSHTFAVRATDTAGNVDATPATHAWTITAPPPPPPGGTAVFTPDHDAEVQANKPTANFGLLTSLTIDTQPSAESYVRFTVNGLSGTVTSVKLRLFVTNGGTNGPLLYATQTGWSETTLTWNTRPAIIGGVLANAASVPAGAWYEFTVTSTVTGNGTYSFLLRPESSDGVVATSRQGTAANRPQLVVVTSP